MSCITGCKVVRVEFIVTDQQGQSVFKKDCLYFLDPSVSTPMQRIFDQVRPRRIELGDIKKPVVQIRISSGNDVQTVFDAWVLRD